MADSSGWRTAQGDGQLRAAVSAVGRRFGRDTSRSVLMTWLGRLIDNLSKSALAPCFANHYRLSVAKFCRTIDVDIALGRLACILSHRVSDDDLCRASTQ